MRMRRCSLADLAQLRLFSDRGGQRLFPLQALCPLCPPPEWALLEGAALSDPGGQSTGMVIWIGDPNLLYTLPAFFALFLLCYPG